VDCFFECLYWPWCSTQICWEDSVLLWVWVERRSVGKLMGFFKERQQQELCHCEKCFFLKCFALGRFCIKMWLPLQMYFPFPVSRKIFLYSTLIFSTFWSMVPIKCHAVVPYQITNIYSLMPVTVIVLLCVNTAATLCYSLCLLGCSGDWAVDVVCDDARKLLACFTIGQSLIHYWYPALTGPAMFTFLCTIIKPY
jgi:hypothetical protein